MYVRRVNISARVCIMFSESLLLGFASALEQNGFLFEIIFFFLNPKKKQFEPRWPAALIVSTLKIKPVRENKLSMRGNFAFELKN